MTTTSTNFNVAIPIYKAHSTISYANSASTGTFSSRLGFYHISDGTFFRTNNCYATILRKPIGY